MPITLFLLESSGHKIRTSLPKSRVDAEQESHKIIIIMMSHFEMRACGREGSARLNAHQDWGPLCSAPILCARAIQVVLAD